MIGGISLDVALGRWFNVMTDMFEFFKVCPKSSTVPLKNAGVWTAPDDTVAGSGVIGRSEEVNTFGMIGTGPIIMSFFCTDSACDVTFASVCSVAKSLASEASHWVWYKGNILQVWRERAWLAMETSTIRLPELWRDTLNSSLPTCPRMLVSTATAWQRERGGLPSMLEITKKRGNSDWLSTFLVDSNLDRTERLLLTDLSTKSFSKSDSEL
ncbi:hypothetical protein CAPTEDRAFT_211935 [Capitella teleta]|uniref:Uncharacterized protein n=1 Tax=Capitella teleta TaxID=283909 RepID=R7V213_CAPTE|nr:hypothetical protein CAPTEDRAFT_211935 [Capitella teleta]|eukprot:ELU09721.1 hypothetical protein CAPTEDRAFT_211935 [Capitella teleta]